MPSASIVIAELVQGSESPSLFTAKTLQQKNNLLLSEFHFLHFKFILPLLLALRIKVGKIHLKV